MSYEDAITDVRKRWSISEAVDECLLSIEWELEGRLYSASIAAPAWQSTSKGKTVVLGFKSRPFAKQAESVKLASPLAAVALADNAPMTPPSERHDSPAPRVSLHFLQRDASTEACGNDATVVPGTPEPSDNEDGHERDVAAGSKDKGKGRAQRRTSSREALAAMADGENGMDSSLAASGSSAASERAAALLPPKSANPCSRTNLFDTNGHCSTPLDSCASPATSTQSIVRPRQSSFPESSGEVKQPSSGSAESPQGITEGSQRLRGEGSRSALSSSNGHSDGEDQLRRSQDPPSTSDDNSPFPTSQEKKPIADEDPEASSEQIHNSNPSTEEERFPVAPAQNNLEACSSASTSHVGDRKRGKRTT
ncbi:hypothetical protein P7C70_g8635, partial [Phenoliferia sp. Uapishka_3]